MVTSAPITENVELDGAEGLAIGIAPSDSGSGFFENIGGCLQEGARIDRAAVDADFEVKVGAGRAAGAANRADHVSGVDLLAHLGGKLRHMGVAGGQAVAVGDLDHFAVARLAPDEAYAAFRRGEDRRAYRTAEVETLVHRAVAGERVAAIAEAGRDVLEIG